MNTRYPLRVTSVGLSLMCISIVGGIALAALLFLLIFLRSFEVIVALGFVGLGLNTLGFIGQIMCVSAPRNMDGKSHLYLSFFLAATSVLFANFTRFSDILLQLVPMRFLQFADPIFSLISLLMYVASTIFFLTFLKYIAIYVNSSVLEYRANHLIKSTPSLLLNFVGILIFSAILVLLNLIVPALIIFIIGTLVTFLLSISHFFSYLGLLNELSFKTRRFELPAENAMGTQ